MSGSNTGTIMKSDGEKEYEFSISKVEETLAKFEQEHSIPEPPAKLADDSKPTPKSDDVKSEQEQEQESAGDEHSTPIEKSGSESDPESSKQKEKPAIPDNYYRAAIHQGWKPEQISKLYESDPQGTVDWLKQMHEATNNLTGQFAELGRKFREVEQQKTQVKQQPESKSELDVEKLREKYEDDPVGTMIEIMKSQNQKPAEQPAQPTQTSHQEEDVAVAQQLHMFFTGKDLELFKEFYGNPDEKNPYDWSKTTPGQAANRKAVINEADAIIAGYEFQGKSISVAEALEKAHLRVSAPIAEKVIREKILSEVKKRSKGITLKPSDSKGKIPDTKREEKSETKAIQTAQAGLNELKKKGL